jgi:hypothetical protein
LTVVVNEEERTMNESAAPGKQPLWLAIEEKILEISEQDLAPDSRERTVQQIAEALDSAGENVSRHGGNMLQLRSALEARAAVGRPFLTDFNSAIGGLGLEDLADTKQATVALVRAVGADWPSFKELNRREDILQIVDKAKLDLMIAKAGEIGGDKGVRYLIEQEVASETIIEALGVTQEKISEVEAVIAAELAAIARVNDLLAEVEGKSDDDRARHLIEKDVPEESIVELAGISQSVIDGVKEKMAAELAEKKRLEEEEAARKAAEAEGPALDAIPPDEMLEHIESIREIMEFSDKEDEIRTMCEQSNIPKSLVDVAVSDPDKLDELEKAAEA